MKIKRKGYYSLLCDSGPSEKDMLICGVYSSKQEAKEVAKEIKDCPAKHIIKKVTVEIEF